MPTPRAADEFAALVGQSGLVAPPTLSQCLGQFQTAAGGPASATDLADHLVAAGLLTRFQADRLLRGKWQGFQIGRYRLLEQLGAGGMGTVYLAEHVHMQRRVALKVLPADRAAEPGALERFHREAQVIAAVNHPNIVRAHDVDQADGLHFLVMEYVDGTSLDRLVEQEGPLEVARAVGLIAQAALGLQHAHEQGLVHRDIKPGNLLVDRRGVVKIADLGLARYFRGGEAITARLNPQAILGTADYMAPEQAAGSPAVDIRADVYALGMTLYYLLAGRSPFGEGSPLQQMLRQICRTPPAIRTVRPDVPEALAAVLERMIAKDAADRFPTPAAVLAALAPWLPAPVPPVAAETPLPPGRLDRPATPHQGTRGPAPATTPVGAEAPTLPIPPAPRRDSAHPRALATPPAGQPARSRPPSSAGGKGRKPDRVPRWMVRTAVGGAGFLFLSACAMAVWWFWTAPPEAAKAPAEPTGSAAGPAAPVSGELTRLAGHDGAVTAAALAPAEPLGLTGGADGTVRLWDITTGKALHTGTGHRGAVTAVGFLASNRFYSAGQDGTVRLWDRAGGAEVAKAAGPAVVCAAASPDGRWLAAAGADGHLRLYDPAHALAVLGDFAAAGGPSHALAFLPDGRQLLSADQDGAVRLWDVLNGRAEVRYGGHGGPVRALAVTADGRQAATADGRGAIHLWEVGGQKLGEWTDPTAGPVALAFTADGQGLVTAGGDGRGRWWDLTTRQVGLTLSSHGGALTALAVRGRRALTASQDGSARLWALPPGAVADGLVGWWPLDEAAGGAVADVTGHGYHGRISGKLAAVSGSRPGLAFDGKASAVVTPPLPALRAWTVAAWVRGDRPSGPTLSVPLAYGERGVLFWGQGGQPEGAAAAVGVLTNGRAGPAAGLLGVPLGPLAADRWYHLAAAFDGQELRSYRDGAEVGKRRVEGRVNPAAGPLTVGCIGEGQGCFAGALADVRLYDRALSAAAVAALARGSDRGKP